MENNITLRAQDFAHRAHDKLTSVSDSGIIRPKAVHLQEVADLVWASGGTDEEIAAAWLHDSIEDTKTSISDIEKNFGKNISSMVNGLTDYEHMANMNIFERKKMQAERVAQESESVRRIKLADQISNVRYVAIDPPADMTDVDRIDYIKGARLIAEKCRGISPLLDNLFEKAYISGTKRYEIK